MITACALMKYAHVKNAEKQIEYQRVYFLDSRWLVCFGLFMLGLLFSFVSLYLVQMMIVVPLMSLGVWFGYQYTSWYNAQRIEKRDYEAYGIVVVGRLIFETCSLNKNSHVGASSVADVFDRTLSFSNNAFLMTSYLILCCFAPFVFIVLNRFETFQRVYVSSTASSM